MPCLNCTSRVLRIFLHDALIPSLRQPLQFRKPIVLSRLSSHLASTHQLRNQSSLATSELTDDDYVPFVYPPHLNPAGKDEILGGGGVRSGWPPPVPETGDYDYEPDIELVEPYEGGEWWDGGVEVAGGVDVNLESLEGVLTGAGSWTLDSSDVAYTLHGECSPGVERKEKRPAVAARKEKGRLEKGRLEKERIGKEVKPERKAVAAGRRPAAEHEEGELEMMYNKGGILDGLELDFKKLVGETPPKEPKKTKRGRRSSPAFEKSQRLAKQDQNPEKEKKPRAKRHAQSTENEERRSSVGKPLPRNKNTDFLENRAFTRGYEEQYLQDEDKSRETSLRRKPIGPGITRDHWDLPTVETSTEPTRLQKWISSRPRNTIERWKIEKANLQAKFGGANWAPLKKLSPEAQESIRVLHKTHPEYTTEKLADKFKVSPEAIRRILRSKWRLGDTVTEEELAERWKRRGERIWDRWVDMGVVQTKWMKKQKRRQWEAERGTVGPRREEKEEKEEVYREENKDNIPKVNMGGISGRIL